MQFDTASQNQIYQVKPMRRLFSNKPGATFNENMPTTTINVRKDCVELVSKVDSGVYAITNLKSAGNGQMRIIANWGRFFDLIQNPEVQIPRCKTSCPTLYRLLTNSFENIILAKKNGDSDYSVCRLVPMTGVIPLLSITKEVLDINKDFVNMMIDICNELSHNPPFPAWKDKLEELWN
jgi:hypothetical protein